MSDEAVDGPTSVPNNPPAPAERVVPVSPPMADHGPPPQVGRDVLLEENVQIEAPTTMDDSRTNPIWTVPVKASELASGNPMTSGEPESLPPPMPVPPKTVPMPHASSVSGPSPDAHAWTAPPNPSESTATSSLRDSTPESNDAVQPRGKPAAVDSASWPEASVLEIDGEIAPQTISATPKSHGQTAEPQTPAVDRENPAVAKPASEAHSTESSTTGPEAKSVSLPRPRMTSAAESLLEVKSASPGDWKSTASQTQSGALDQHEEHPAVAPHTASFAARPDPVVFEKDPTQTVWPNPDRPNQPVPIHSNATRTELVTAQPKPNRPLGPSAEQSVQQVAPVASTIENAVKSPASIEDRPTQISPKTIKPDFEAETSVVAPSPLPTRSESKPMDPSQDAKPSNSESQESSSTTNPVMITIGKVVIEWESENTGQNRPTLPKGIDIHKPWN